MSKITFLDSIDVKSPCSEKWSEMKGNEQIRFCSHCAENVHNLSEMTRKQARKIVAASNGKICVRYARRPDGRIQTIKNTLHQITRQTGIAAGVLGTSMSLSTLAYAQATEEPAQVENTQIVQIVSEKTDAPTGAITGTITGTITDPNGAVIPFALVTLMNEQSGFYQSVNSNQEGVYEFKDVPTGDYKLKVDAGGFASKEIAQIAVGGGEQNYNAQMAIETMQEVVTVGGNEEVTYTVSGGAIMSIVRYNKLVIAVEGDNFDEVKMLVAKGERINAKDKGYGKNTALHVAVENGNLEISEFLLMHGAKINSKNADKRTILMMLDEDATPELVNLLVRYGAKINLADKEGNTALMFAAEYASGEVVQTLISAGANINTVNRKGETALMRAAENDELENVKLLLGAGANAQFRTKNGDTALSMTGNEQVKQFLISYGAVE